MLLVLWRQEFFFLVVPAAGALLVRLRTRESLLLVVLTSGAVMGTCLFWLGVWALFPLLRGPSAVLWSIALVAGVAAAAWRWGRPVDLPPLTLPSRAEVIGLGLLVGLVALSILHTSTSLLEFSETMTFHVPTVASMERGNVPPINVQEPSYPLYYHYGQHVLAAALASFGRLRPPMALFVTNAWFGGLVVAYAYALGRKMIGVWAGFAAAILLFGAGTLNWITALPALTMEQVSFAKLMNPLGFPFSTGNISVGPLAWRVHGNSMAWAMCLALLVCDLFERAFRNRRFELAVGAGIALATLAPANETLYSSIATGIGLVSVLFWLRQRKIDWPQAALATLVLSIGLLLVFFTAGVIKTFLLKGSATHGASLMINWKNFGTVASFNFGGFFPPGPTGRVPIFSLRFLGDVGPLPFLLIPALVWWVLRSEWLAVHFAASALIALFFSTALTLTRYPENTCRLVNLCVVLSAIPIGLALATLPRTLKGKVARHVAVAAVGTLLLLCIVSWPLLHVGVMATATYGKKLFPPADGGHLYNLAAIDFLTENTKFDEGVLSIPYRSWAVLGSGQCAPTGSYVGGLEEFPRDSSKAVEAVDLDLFRKLGARYLYVESAGASDRQRHRIARLSAAGELQQIWVAPDQASVIYKLTN